MSSFYHFDLHDLQHEVIPSFFHHFDEFFFCYLFVFLVLLYTITCFRGDVSLVFSLIVVNPIRALLSSATWFNQQLVSIRSLKELRTFLLAIIDRVIGRVKMDLARRSWFQRIVPGLRWLSPAELPLENRLSSLVIFAPALLNFYVIIWLLFLPLGFLGGVFSTRLDEPDFCVHLIEQDYYVDSSLLIQLPGINYCAAWAVGFELQAKIQDDWLPFIFHEEYTDFQLFSFAATNAVLVVEVLRSIAISLAARADQSSPSSSEAAGADNLKSSPQKEKAHEPTIEKPAIKPQLLPQLLPQLHQQNNTHDLRVKVQEIDKVKESLAELNGLVKTKSKELKVAKLTLKWVWAFVKSLIAARNQFEETRRRDRITIKRQYEAQFERQLSSAKTQVKVEEESATERVQTLSGELLLLRHQSAQLTKQLEEKGHAADCSLSEIQSLKADLENRKEQIANMEHRLAASAAHALDLKTWADRQIDTERQQHAVQISELVAQQQQLQEASSEYLSLKTSYDALFESCMELEQEKADLQRELEMTRNTAETRFRELQDHLATAERNLAGAQDLRLAYDQTREAHDLDNAARINALVEENRRIQNLNVALDEQAFAIMSESAGYQQKAHGLEDSNRNLLMTVKNLEETVLKLEADKRSLREEHEYLGGENADLRQRLYKEEVPQGMQEIPVTKLGDVGSISTALQEREVEIALLLHDKADLQRQLAEAKQGRATPNEAERMRAEIEKLRRIAAEERKRADNLILPVAQEKEKLKAEVQRLTIENSNLRARGGGSSPFSPLRGGKTRR